QRGPPGVVHRGHGPTAAAIARRLLTAQRTRRQRETRAHVVDVAGDSRVARSSRLGGLGRAQPAEGREDAGPRGCVGEVGPGAGRPSKASTSIRVSKLTVTAGGVPVMMQRYRLYVDALHGRTQRRWLLVTASSRPRITFRACSGVTTSCAFPRMASRTFS